MSHSKSCQRCTKEFDYKESYFNPLKINNFVVSPETTAFLSRSYYGRLCNTCLSEVDYLVDSSKNDEYPKIAKDMIEGTHYYIQNGYKVFTEKFHFLRGQCCQNKCKNCAYGYNK